MQWGKGLAIIEGFKDALLRSHEFIGFVDADMATTPQAFYDLIVQQENCDGIIASRYLPGSLVTPKERPLKVYGSRFFNGVLRLLFWFPFKDTQCGAKIFKAASIKEVLPRLHCTQWAFDVELLFGLQKKETSLKKCLPFGRIKN